MCRQLLNFRYSVMSLGLLLASCSGSDIDTFTDVSGDSFGPNVIPVFDPLRDVQICDEGKCRIPPNFYENRAPSTSSTSYLYDLFNERLEFPTYWFELDQFEITQKMFRELAPQGLVAPTQTKVCDDCPMGNVTWHEAAAFCNHLSEAIDRVPCYSCAIDSTSSQWRCVPSESFLSEFQSDRTPSHQCAYRLPTREEWIYARFGRDFSNQFSVDEKTANEIAWYKVNSMDQPHEVGTQTPTSFGLFDMSGNVAEWTNTWNDGTQTKRWVFGGGWSSEREGLGLISLPSLSPEAREKAVGFRCVRKLDEGFDVERE